MGCKNIVVGGGIMVTVLLTARAMVVCVLVVVVWIGWRTLSVVTASNKESRLIENRLVGKIRRGECCGATVRVGPCCDTLTTVVVATACSATCWVTILSAETPRLAPRLDKG